MLNLRAHDLTTLKSARRSISEFNMQSLFRFVLLYLVATAGFTLVTFELRAQTLPDSVILTARSTTGMAGRSGFLRIMLHSNRNLAGLFLPLSIEDPRLIIDSVSIAHSIARTSTGWVIQLSETQRRAAVIVVPTFAGLDLYEFPSRDGEFIRIHWTIRPEATAGVAEVDTFFLSSGLAMNASTVSGISSDCYFIPGTITFERWVCGRIGGGSVNDLSNVVYLLRYIFGGGTPPLDQAYGDVNCDQRVSVSDAIYLLNFQLNGGPWPCAACNGN